MDDEVEKKKLATFVGEYKGKVMDTDLIGGEMEGAGMWVATADVNIQCIVIKGVSDHGVGKGAAEGKGTMSRARTSDEQPGRRWR